MNIELTLTDVQSKCLSTEIVDIQAHFQALAEHMAERIGEAIYEAEVARMNADPNVTTIPADKETVVLSADVQTAAERQTAIEAELP
jgi:hypothetical protein